MDWILEETDMDSIDLLTWLEQTDFDLSYSPPVAEVDSIDPLPFSAGLGIVSASSASRHASMSSTAPPSSMTSAGLCSISSSMEDEEGGQDEIASMPSHNLESLSQGVSVGGGGVEVSIPPPPPPPPPPTPAGLFPKVSATSNIRPLIISHLDGDNWGGSPGGTDFSNNMNPPTYTTTCTAIRNPRRQTATQHITVPSRFDVVDGRGRGILQLPGNQTYRVLVSMNKRIYARCHKYDKGKVSKGIVAAIRQLGGRFLEYDKESKTYHDMGDKKAMGKTSQALREGLKKIRQQFYSNLAAGHNLFGFDTDLLFLDVPLVPLPAERYFEYSVQMLQSLSNTR
jgi:hypothetical protein